MHSAPFSTRPEATETNWPCCRKEAESVPGAFRKRARRAFFSSLGATSPVAKNVDKFELGFVGIIKKNKERKGGLASLCYTRS